MSLAWVKRSSVRGAKNPSTWLSFFCATLTHTPQVSSAAEESQLILVWGFSFLLLVVAFSSDPFALEKKAKNASRSTHSTTIPLTLLTLTTLSHLTVLPLHWLQHIMFNSTATTQFMPHHNCHDQSSSFHSYLSSQVPFPPQQHRPCESSTSPDSRLSFSREEAELGRERSFQELQSPTRPSSSITVTATTAALTTTLAEENWTTPLLNSGLFQNRVFHPQATMATQYRKSCWDDEAAADTTEDITSNGAIGDTTKMTKKNCDPLQSSPLPTPFTPTVATTATTTTLQQMIQQQQSNHHHNQSPTTFLSSQLPNSCTNPISNIHSIGDNNSNNTLSSNTNNTNNNNMNQATTTTTTTTTTSTSKNSTKVNGEMYKANKRVQIKEKKIPIPTNNNTTNHTTNFFISPSCNSNNNNNDDNDNATNATTIPSFNRDPNYDYFLKYRQITEIITITQYSNNNNNNNNSNNNNNHASSPSKISKKKNRITKTRNHVFIVRQLKPLSSSSSPSTAVPSTSVITLPQQQPQQLS